MARQTSEEILTLVRAAQDAEARDDREGALHSWSRIADLERADPGPMHTTYLMRCASACLDAGREAEAFDIVAEVRQQVHPLAGPPDVAWIGFMNVWGSMLVQVSRYAEAAEVYRDLVERTRQSAYRAYSDYYDAHLQLVRVLARGVQDPAAALTEARTLAAHFAEVEVRGPLAFHADRTFDEVLFLKATLEEELAHPIDASDTLRALLTRVQRRDPDGADAEVVREALARVDAAR